MRSVSQEMTAEERRTRLLHGLSATSEPEVVVNFSHLAHAIGMDSAERMIGTLVAMDGIVQTPYSRKPKYISEGLCTISREEAIEAIHRVRAKTAKLQIDNMIKKKPV